VSSLLTLMIVIGAFWLLVRNLPGVKEIAAPVGAAAGRSFAWLIRLIFMLLLGMVATAVDLTITLALMATHSATARPLMVTDDWAAFLLRLNDRLLRLLTT